MITKYHEATINQADIEHIGLTVHVIRGRVYITGDNIPERVTLEDGETMRLTLKRLSPEVLLYGILKWNNDPIGDEVTSGPVATEHKLIDATLVREPGGIVARCICGWVSRPCFSSMVASNEFQTHRDGVCLLRSPGRG